MTAQTPERIIIDGRPHGLYKRPLDRLIKQCRLDLSYPDGFCTGNYRGYVGTWELRERRLYLVHLCWSCGEELPMAKEVRNRVLRAARCDDFPVHAHWFNGVIRIAAGRRIVYSHHGWSHWFERERVAHLKGGNVTRDRIVDTRAILEWWLKRNPDARGRLDGSNPAPVASLTWFDDDDNDWTADWWPPDYVRASAKATSP